MELFWIINGDCGLPVFRNGFVSEGWDFCLASMCFLYAVTIPSSRLENSKVPLELSIEVVRLQKLPTNVGKTPAKAGFQRKSQASLNFQIKFLANTLQVYYSNYTFRNDGGVARMGCCVFDQGKGNFRRISLSGWHPLLLLFSFKTVHTYQKIDHKAAPKWFIYLCHKV